jgi:hypothetical protein
MVSPRAPAVTSGGRNDLAHPPVAGVLAALGESARERMAACEQAAQDAGLLD